jgi:hypothetical protein
MGIGKDVADTALQFMYASGASGVQKVSTGIIPNVEDVYRITVYISPKSEFYVQIEVLNKSVPTVVRVLNPTTNTPTANKLAPTFFINNVATGIAISYGLIKLTEEIY